MKTKLLIFGITGDLGHRKLLPAINEIVASGDFDDLEIIGVSRHDVDIAEILSSALGESNSLSSRVSIFTTDLSTHEEYMRLKQRLQLADDEQLLIYLSVPPSATMEIVDHLGEAGLNTPNVKILFEKPFGVDYDSAVDVISRTANYYKDEQVYRVDHYLAKEMAQNIVAFRGGNAMFSHLWNSNMIEKIEVVALETISVEGRAHFYEQTGALRDVVQGHLIQLLALALIDIPHNFDWDTLPALRLEALEQIEIADPLLATRAQYDSYRQEVDNPTSLTETFVSLQLSSRDPEWQGIPLVLITGKSMDQKTTEIRVHLRKTHEAQGNCIKFCIQPDEGIEIEVFVKKPGYERQFETQTMKFNYPSDVKLPDAYEHVIVDAIKSRKSLFTSSGEVLRSWEILKPVQDSWKASNELKIYDSGSSPHEVSAL